MLRDGKWCRFWAISNFSLAGLESMRKRYVARSSGTTL